MSLSKTLVDVTSQRPSKSRIKQTIHNCIKQAVEKVQDETEHHIKNSLPESQ